MSGLDAALIVVVSLIVCFTAVVIVVGKTPRPPTTHLGEVDLLAVLALHDLYEAMYYSGTNDEVSWLATAPPSVIDAYARAQAALPGRLRVPKP